MASVLEFEITISLQVNSLIFIFVIFVWGFLIGVKINLFIKRLLTIQVICQYRKSCRLLHIFLELVSTGKFYPLLLRNTIWVIFSWGNVLVLECSFYHTSVSSALFCILVILGQKSSSSWDPVLFQKWEIRGRDKVIWKNKINRKKREPLMYFFHQARELVVPPDLVL